MKTSKLLLVSIFITAIILVVIGGVTSNVLASKASNSGTDQEAIKVMQEREANYNQLIQQANQQLEKANADLQAMQNQVNQLQQQKGIDQPAANTVQAAISVKKASEIANQVAALGEKPLKDPELVSFEGKAAYEVQYEKGSIYVEAQSGEVLFNGTVPQTISAEKAAQIAADYLKNPNILQVDQIQFRGNPIYRVIFKDGTFVFMDLTGQITFIQAPGPRATNLQASTDSGGSSSQPSTSHESESGHDD